MIHAKDICGKNVLQYLDFEYFLMVDDQCGYITLNWKKTPRSNKPTISMSSIQKISKHNFFFKSIVK
jgi:hypothetical protein